MGKMKLRHMRFGLAEAEPLDCWWAFLVLFCVSLCIWSIWSGQQHCSIGPRMFALSKHIQSCALRKALLARSGIQVVNKSFPTSLKTYAPLSSNVKTPIQAWGHEYLFQQKALGRPLSPHLGIYQAQLTWYLSGLHRITGVVMGTTVGLFAAGLMFMPFDFTQLIEYIRLAGLPTALVYFVKYCIAWPLTYHALNGLRFVGFDLALGIDLPSVYKSGWFVMGASIVLGIIFTFWRKSDKEDVKAIATK